MQKLLKRDQGLHIFQPYLFRQTPDDFIFGIELRELVQRPLAEAGMRFAYISADSLQLSYIEVDGMDEIFEELFKIFYGG